MNQPAADARKLAIFAVSALVYIPLSQWLSTTPVGTWIFLWGQLVYFLPTFVAFLAFPFLVIGLAFRSSRGWSWLYLRISLLLVPCCIVGIALGQRIRMAGMGRFAERSQTLVSAIEQFERDHMDPPGSLEELVPEYLPEVPSTGMMAYPEYLYFSGDAAREAYLGNRWALVVWTPSGGINFDKMLYLPDQNYPQQGFGGALERLGDWAYVHE